MVGIKRLISEAKKILPSETDSLSDENTQESEQSKQQIPFLMPVNSWQNGLKKRLGSLMVYPKVIWTSMFCSFHYTLELSFLLYRDSYYKLLCWRTIIAIRSVRKIKTSVMRVGLSAWSIPYCSYGHYKYCLQN